MKPLLPRRPILVAGVASALLSAALIAQPIHRASSQQPPPMSPNMPGHGQMPGTMQRQHMHDHGSGLSSTTAPTMPGQDAFGAIQEVVSILEADPKTDWSKVDLEGLRQHLVDMNEVTLKAVATTKPIDGGLQISVTGTGRTLAAIQRMVPAHAHELNQMNGWQAKTELLADGVLLTVTASDPKEVVHIRGLGFIGLLASGSHHQPHHLAMAKGEFSHHH